MTTDVHRTADHPHRRNDLGYRVLNAGLYAAMAIAVVLVLLRAAWPIGGRLTGAHQTVIQAQ